MRIVDRGSSVNCFGNASFGEEPTNTCVLFYISTLCTTFVIHSTVILRHSGERINEVKAVSMESGMGHGEEA